MAKLRLEPPARHQGLSVRDEDCFEKVLDGRCVEHHHRYCATGMKPREIRGIARFARRVVPVDQVVRCKDELSSGLLPARRLAGFGIELRPSFAISQARLPQHPLNTGDKVQGSEVDHALGSSLGFVDSSFFYATRRSYNRRPVA